MQLKKLKNWSVIYVIYAFVLLISFTTDRMILRTSLSIRNIVGLLILSMILSIIPCVGGYLGKRIIFMIYTIFAFCGIVYSLYIALTNITPGWSDLISFLSSVYIIAIGTVISFIGEIVGYFMKRRK